MNARPGPTKIELDGPYWCPGHQWHGFGVRYERQTGTYNRVGAPGISDTALGYAMNARPGPTMIELDGPYWCPGHQWHGFGVRYERQTGTYNRVGAPGISDTALGYAMNARPGPTMIELDGPYWCPGHQWHGLGVRYERQTGTYNRFVPRASATRPWGTLWKPGRDLQW